MAGFERRERTLWKDERGEASAMSTQHVVQQDL
jgi:hypothetical protein